MDTEIGTCLPIHVLVFVSLKESFWTQIDSKSNIATFLSFFLTCELDTEGVQLVKESFSDLIYVPRIDLSHSFSACS